MIERKIIQKTKHLCYDCGKVVVNEYVYIYPSKEIEREFTITKHGLKLNNNIHCVCGKIRFEKLEGES